MPYSPPYLAPRSPVFISPMSPWAIGVELAALAVVAPVLTLTQVTAHLARAYPFTVPEPTLINKLWWYNGSTVTGATTVDVGIYNEDGSVLMGHATATQATVSVIQEVDPTDFTLPRGRYYMALVASTTTTTFASHTSTVQLCKAMGLWQAALGSSVLTATITPATYVAGSVFIYGAAGRTLVV